MHNVAALRSFSPARARLNERDCDAKSSACGRWWSKSIGKGASCQGSFLKTIGYGAQMIKGRHLCDLRKQEDLNEAVSSRSRADMERLMTGSTFPQSARY
ncbi:hypothetical protein CBOM_08143 [Ceraceosorus bombacis]|uniref:Uncharacterized protein n=1 Tax=Ceraceosorus bombacis TaxID=401625 RepID=A0A0P1B9Z7_9BASI|nr:hypothetical protein CBOM_08143 [Ceraceosorus bombacis]